MSAFAAMLLAMAAAPAPAPPPAVRWEHVVRDGAIDYFVDPASLVRTGAVVRLRVRWIASGPRPGQARSALAISEVDCAARSATLLAVRTFDAAGRTLETRQFPPGRRRAAPIGRGASDQAMFRRACASPTARPRLG